MARLGYIEWNSSEEADASDLTPFADPEVRARMAAVIARAAQRVLPQQDLSPRAQPAGDPDDAD